MKGCVVALVAVLLGCGDSNETPLSRVVPDERGSRFVLDQTLPFRIELGRGSGLYGLDTISLDESGSVIIHRNGSKGWESAALELRPSELKAVLDSLAKNGVLHLHRGYHANVVDGTQWVFLATQGDRAKAVYCNNYFPEEIVAFASDLDSQLNIQSRQMVWKPVPLNKARNHEARLWASIESQ